MTELRRPALLDPPRNDREQFDSGEPVLDEWLRRYAGQNRRRDTAATWVIADANDVVVAYAIVAMTGIDRSAAPEMLAKGTPDPGGRHSAFTRSTPTILTSSTSAS